MSSMTIPNATITGEMPMPSVVPIGCYEFERDRAARAEAELTAAREREAALAAALEETDAAFEKFAAHHGPCCHVHNSTDETALGECCLCDIDRDARQRGDYAPILARVRREAKREDLRKVKTAAIECIKVMLFESSGRHDRVSRDSYCEGVNDVIADIDAALAALDAEEKEAQNG